MTNADVIGLLRTVKTPTESAAEHLQITRRYFLRLAAAGVAGAAGLSASPVFANEKKAAKRFASEISYLTPSDKFHNVERHKPLPYKLPLEKRLELGLERETWKLEIIPDPESNSRLRNPMTKEKGTALDFPGLMKLAETKAARFMKVMTCNNLGDPLGMGLWEGVPLRDAIWLARPDSNIRRLFYRGYHNEVEKQIFQSSLPIGRVLEDPLGEHPVILCYKFNGKPLTGERGGPVRMIVPDAYGFKSVKWIQTIYLTNNHQANDTYAKQNNDIDSRMKTFARLISWPKSARAGQPIPISGVAQAGQSGLSKVQYWLNSDGKPLPSGNRYFETADWKDAEILPPPDNWGGDFPGGKLPAIPGQIDESGRPIEWPPRYTLAHWAALLPNVAPGKYDLRCRSIDKNGAAQPMPRPFAKSGGNKIHSVSLTVRG